MANCVIYDNACILSQLLDYVESKGNFRDAGDIVDLDQLVSRLAVFEWKNADAEQVD